MLLLLTKTCYYLNFCPFWGATNRDVLLTKACYCSRLYGMYYDTPHDICFMMLFLIFYFRNSGPSRVRNNELISFYSYLQKKLAFLTRSVNSHLAITQAWFLKQGCELDHTHSWSCSCWSAIICWVIRQSST